MQSFNFQTIISLRTKVLSVSISTIGSNLPSCLLSENDCVKEYVIFWKKKTIEKVRKMIILAAECKKQQHQFMSINLIIWKNAIIEPTKPGLPYGFCRRLKQLHQKQASSTTFNNHNGFQ